MAKRVQRAESTVRTWCNSGELEAFKLNGRDWRVRESALERYLEGQEVEAPSGRALGSAEEPDLASWRHHLQSETDAA